MAYSYKAPQTVSRLTPTHLAALTAAISSGIDGLGGHTQAAAHIDMPRTTLQDWGADPTFWRGDKLLSLGRLSQEVCETITSIIHNTQAPEAQPTEAIPEACETVCLAADLTAELITAIRAGGFNRHGQRSVVMKIRTLELMLAKLERDVRASAAVAP